MPVGRETGLGGGDARVLPCGFPFDQDRLVGQGVDVEAGQRARTTLLVSHAHIQQLVDLAHLV